MAARHQFEEGDVQHWWHPPAVGSRTRISDDYFVAPYVVEHYVCATGDAAILTELVPFFADAGAFEPSQEEIYGEPEITAETATLYEHCLCALDHGLQFGAHGLPLMGTGDWNDGMNRVGAGGKGESVWLGWFLYTNLMAFADWPNRGRYGARRDQYRAAAETLQHALNDNVWDGEVVSPRVF